MMLVSFISDCASQPCINCFLFQYLYTSVSLMCRMLGAKPHPHFLADDSSAKKLSNFTSSREKNRALGPMDSSSYAWIFVGVTSRLWLFSFIKHKSKSPADYKFPGPSPGGTGVGPGICLLLLFF